MAPKSQYSLVIHLILFNGIANSFLIDLNGQWMIHNSNKSISVSGKVPGSVHMALFYNGVIEEPYFRFNDINYRWVAYDNWTYTRSFTGQGNGILSVCSH